MTTPFNSLSRCPVLTMPTGRASNGVPTSIQIVGRTYTDKDVFQAGMAYESLHPDGLRKMARGRTFPVPILLR